MPRNYENPLPGVPNVESPFFSELFDEGHPHYQAAKDLRDNGFAVIDFPEPAFDEMAERIKRDLHDQVDWQRWRASGGEARIGSGWTLSDDVKAIATNQAMIDMLGELYGRKAFPFQTLNFPVGTQQHYHTDSIHFSCMPERFMCGVWVAFEDIGKDQGPLVYYPGSHKWPIYRNEHIGHNAGLSGDFKQDTFHPLWERLVEIHGVEPEYFHPRKGQALIWAANLLHGGAMHLDRTRTRWSQVTHYYFEDCVYYTPLGSNEPAFEVLIRAPDDIAEGRQVHSTYLNSPVRAPFTRAAGTPAFDPARYLELSTDVRDSGWDPWQHFVLHGIEERRRWF